ncbi:MAG: tail fiber domain-containing protein [Bacteroidales bacterium]|nr:tail fiber domain-containing protein [Bacteroidales bacterium]
MKKWIVCCLLAAMCFPFMSNAQIKVVSSGATEIGGGPLSSDEPALTIRGGFNPGPIFPAKLDLGISKGSIRFSETFIGSCQMEIYALRGINFVSKFNNVNKKYMYYCPDSGDVLNITAAKTATQDLYCTTLYQTSDAKYKKNIVNLPNPLSQLTKLRGVSYQLDASDNPMVGSRRGIVADSLTQNEESAPDTDKKHIGFIAQELQEVFPELVTSDKDGNLYVDYIGLIPVLVEALKEQKSKQEELNSAQSAKIAELQTELNALKGDAVTPKMQAQAVANAYLYQNTPNPFDYATTIRYYLPENASKAFVHIFNMQGSLLKSYQLSNGFGEGFLEISASELQPGMYLYSLMIDNTEIDTKRMVITQ